MDGKSDIVFGSDHGDVYVVEADGAGGYGQVWHGAVETHNAFLHCSTKDIDGNGKPEFWVGGDAYYNGMGMTRFTCFEMNGNNSYVPVARVDLVGVFSFFAGNCFAKDIDSDGKEELFICIDQNVIILKFAGRMNHITFTVFYLKQNELIDQNSIYEGASLYDTHGDNKTDLFICKDHINGTGRREYTQRFRPKYPQSVRGPMNSTPTSFRLYQNYPNPFNPTTTIMYSLQSNTYVTLEVFDLLGKVVATVVKQKQDAGVHQARFDGSFLPSGIYFYRLQAENFLAVKKLVLLK